jgi:hypothetical protein
LTVFFFGFTSSTVSSCFTPKAMIPRSPLTNAGAVSNERKV